MNRFLPGLSSAIFSICCHFTISLTLEEFLVILSDGSEILFPNRLGASEYLDFSFDEGVLIRSFEIN
ncbi:unnamed protein product [Gadus morhua 'NCC']